MNQTTKTILATIIITFTILFLVYQIYSVGYAKGFIDLQRDILTPTLNCQPFPITFNNQTVNLIIAECLQQGEVGG